MRMKRRGVEMRLIIEGADALPRKPDAALLKVIARAHQSFEELISARATSLAAIANREGVTNRYVTRLIRLAFRADVEASRARQTGRSEIHPHVDLPLDWMTQEWSASNRWIAPTLGPHAHHVCPRHRQTRVPAAFTRSNCETEPTCARAERNTRTAPNDADIRPSLVRLGAQNGPQRRPFSRCSPEIAATARLVGGERWI